MRSPQIYLPSLLNLSLWVALPALATAGAAGYLGYSTWKNQEGPSEVARIQDLTRLGNLYAENFWLGIETIRTQGQSFAKIRNLEPSAPLSGKIIHWSEIEADRTVRATAKNSSRLTSIAFDEARYLGTLATLNPSEIQSQGIAVVRVKPDPLRSTEWLAFAFPNPHRAGSIVTALVDPAELMASMRATDQAHSRTYLLGKDGVVYAHSQLSYVGANFSRLSGLTALRAPQSSVGRFTAMDQLEVLAAHMPLGKLPLGIVVEEALELEEAAVTEAKLGAVAQTTGQFLAALGGIILLILGSAWQVRKRLAGSLSAEQLDELEAGVLADDSASDSITRSPNFEEWIKKATEEHEAQGKPASEPPSLNLADLTQGASGATLAGPITVARSADAMAEAALAAQEKMLRQELQASQSALKTAQEENALLSQFELEASTLKDPKTVSTRMTSLASRLCHSPALFFGYQETTKSAVLHTMTGYNQNEIPSHFSFPITPELLKALQDSERNGRLLSLAEYEPLAQALMARLGIAHFEAWAVSGFGHLGRQAGKPRLLGVLVLTQAGIESAMRRESLSRMMRVTGLVYENTLLSQ